MFVLFWRIHGNHVEPKYLCVKLKSLTVFICECKLVGLCYSSASISLECLLYGKWLKIEIQEWEVALKRWWRDVADSLICENQMDLTECDPVIPPSLSSTFITRLASHHIVNVYAYYIRPPMFYCKILIFFLIIFSLNTFVYSNTITTNKIMK